MNSMVSLVHTSPLFSEIPTQRLAEILSSVKRCFYKKGTKILVGSEVQHHFLYLIHGWLKVYKESMDGQEIVVDILTDNDFFGEQFVFQEGPKVSYTIRSLSDLELLFLPIKILKQLIVSDHQLSLNFLKTVLKKQSYLSSEVEHLSIQNASQRIGCFLLRLCATKLNENLVLQLPYDKAVLATRLGMRPETFSRAPAKLVSQCDAQINGDQLIIKHRSELIRYVCQHRSKVYPCIENSSQ